MTSHPKRPAMAALDHWIAKQREPELTRPEAIRRLVEIGLNVKTNGRTTTEGQKLRAREMASVAIDSMTDSSAHPSDQDSRKRRLLKGPEEFSDVRVDRSTAKRK